MKRLLTLVICLMMTLSVLSKLNVKVVEGNTTFLKLQPCLIEVKWDFSDTNYDGFTDITHLLENKATRELWEKNLSDIKNAFMVSLKGKDTENNHIYSDNLPDSKYLMQITPKYIGSDGRVDILLTVKERIGNLNVVIFFEHKKTNYENLKQVSNINSFLISVFKEVGKKTNDLISITSDLSDKDKIWLIDQTYKAISPYMTIEPPLLKYAQVVPSNFVISKDSLFDLCQEYLSKVYVDSKAVIQVLNKEKGIIIGKGIFVHQGFFTYKCPHIITINVKDGKIRLCFEINKVEHHSARLLDEKNILQCYPFSPQDDEEDNLDSFEDYVAFVFEGINNTVSFFNAELNSQKPNDDW